MTEKSYAPIVLFVYNRPGHVRNTLHALQKNDLASESELFIYSDGPQNGAHSIGRVDEVRTFIKTIKGFKNITIIENKQNKGLADSIIKGVSDIVKRYGRVIVLEDDLIVSPYFLRFMNEALCQYQFENKVMHVSGYFWPLVGIEADSFFLTNINSWGWGTWDRAWAYFNEDATLLLKQIEDLGLKDQFDLNASRSFYAMLQSQASENGIDSWAIRWYASIFLAQGLACFPGQSLVQNKGMDGTGTHCSVTADYDTELIARKLNLTGSIKVCKDVREKLILYFHDINSGDKKKESALPKRMSVKDFFKMFFQK